MPKFDGILQNERRLRAFTGLNTATFTYLLNKAGYVLCGCPGRT
jgi:hypothetical protein